ncbi:hypothetical protein DPM33_30365 [Mesorhizobium hawassense]|uniref:Transposase DDE domain-containing protein n=1 Tax=Mesorhizobium hawassense TaxID=1209954 RepID=A0A330H7X8_9HYPH|nr:hypothetical protein DPM33_30365 [Mesorhizobium hawassense]
MSTRGPSRSIKRSGTAKGFERLSRRWVVERTIALLRCCRWLANDIEMTIAKRRAWIASVSLILRSIATPPHA